MKKNGAFVNLFLSGRLQKSPQYRGQPKKIGAELLCFSELEATVQKNRNFVTQISKLFTFTGYNAAKTA